MKRYISSAIISASLLCVPLAGAQTASPDSKFSIKASAGIGLGNAYSASSDLPGVSLTGSSANTFGVDFRYRFWQHDNLSLGLNAGVAYSIGSQSLKASGLSFNYAAGADADMDGDTYQRHTSVEDMTQQINTGEFGIPVYVDLNWQLSKRFAIFADAGLGFMFSTSATIKNLDGRCTAYGVYPQYGNLKIDDECMNDFGESTLSGAATDNPQQNSFCLNLRAGAGIRVWLFGPLSLECGIGYNHGFMDRLKTGGMGTGNISEQQAPVSYTVAEGRRVKPLSNALTSDHLSNLNLRVGLIFSL